MDIDAEDIVTRLDALRGDLDRFPAGVSCPWPLARIYNELLRQAREIVAADPVVQILRPVEQGGGEFDPDASTALVGTVGGLIGQLRIALQEGPADASSSRAQAGS
jgi:hypothetical protein